MPEYDCEIIYFYLSGRNEFYRQQLRKRIENIFTSKEKSYLVRIKRSDELFAKETHSKEGFYLYILNDYDNISENPFGSISSYDSYVKTLLIPPKRTLLEGFKGIIYILMNGMDLIYLDPRLQEKCSLTIKTDLGFDVISAKTFLEYFFFTKKTENPHRLLEKHFEMFIESKLYELIEGPFSANISDFRKFQQLNSFLDSPEINHVIETSRKLRRLSKKYKKKEEI